MASPQNAPQTPRLSDEELEYYGDLYIQCRIREAGVDFENFLGNPEYYLQKHARRYQSSGGADGNGRRKSLREFLRLG
jgi:hypothetical protein